MKRLGIRGKVLLGFLALIAFFALNSIYIFVIVNDSKYIVFGVFEEKDKDVEVLKEFQDLVQRSRLQTLNWVFQRKDDEGKRQLRLLHDQEYPTMKLRMQKVMSLFASPQQAEKMNSLFYACDTLLEKQSLIMQKLSTFEAYDDPLLKFEAEELLETSIDPLSKDIFEKIERQLKEKKQEKQAARQEIADSLNSLLTTVALSLLAVSAIGLIMSFYTANSITRPVNRVREIIEMLSVGEQPDRINTFGNDEVGDMSRAVNTLMQGLRDTSNFAENIGKENFNASFTPLSENDVLGNSLMNMRNNLQRIAIEDDKRYWANEGTAKFSDMLRKFSQSNEALADHILPELVMYMKASHGSFFVINNSNPKNQFMELIACYAWNRRKYIEKRIEIGDGLVGQAWIEKDALFITDVPPNYIKIASGLGETNPQSVLIVPLIFNEQVLGIIELASLYVFDNHEKDFLKRLGESFAATISSIKNNEVNERLLTDSQEMSEQLRAQEEEMRQNLEELMTSQEEMERKAYTYEQKLKIYESKFGKI